MQVKDEFMTSLINKLVAIGTLLATSLGVVAQETTLTGEPPTFVLGDQWEFLIENNVKNTRVTTMQRVTEIVGPDTAWSLVTNLDNDNKVWRLLDRTKVQDIAARRYDTSKSNLRGALLLEKERAVRIQFPLSIGKQYTMVETWPDGNGISRFEAKVEAIETMTVPAGTFEAWRISIQGTWESNTDPEMRGTSKSTFWYAPAAKRTIKSDNKSFRNGRLGDHLVTTLKSWQPGGDSK